MSISRADVCIGVVQKYRLTDKFYLPETSRSMLFVPNGAIAMDLMYDSPRYPLYESPIDFRCKSGVVENPEIVVFHEGSILRPTKINWSTTGFNQGNDKEVQTNKSIIMIGESYNLALLLEHFGYKGNLSYEDVINIRKTFFNGRFPIENCEEFGYKADILGEVSLVEETPISGYWDVLRDCGDSVITNYNFLGWDISIIDDAFVPDKRMEGHIKKRKRFNELRKDNY